MVSHHKAIHSTVSSMLSATAEKATARAAEEERASAETFEHSMGARNRVGIGLSWSYRPTRLHSRAGLVPWNRFLGSLKALGNLSVYSLPRGNIAEESHNFLLSS
jgi:hypothetical protein